MSTKQSPAPPVAKILLIGFHFEKKMSPLCSLMTWMLYPFEMRGYLSISTMAAPKVWLVL